LISASLTQLSFELAHTSNLPKEQISTLLSKSLSQQANMSGFVEKLFDSFSGQGHSNQQQQQQENNSYGQQQGNYGQQQNYGGQQANYGQQQQPQVPYPWVARWDDRENRYIYINEQTGERSFSPPGQGYGGGNEQRGNYGNQQDQYSNQGYGNQQSQYGGEEKKGHGNAAAWGVGGAAVGLGAGALLMHEGEDMSMTSILQNCHYRDMAC
jgi:hypothetical protein